MPTRSLASRKELIHVANSVTNAGTFALTTNGIAVAVTENLMGIVANIVVSHLHINAPMMGLTVTGMRGNQCVPLDKFLVKRSHAMEHALTMTTVYQEPTMMVS